MYNIMEQYTKFQIAQLYFPELDDRSARRKLARWMQQAHGLMPALRQTGYNPRQHGFTQKQLAIVYEYLGEPE